MNISFLKWPVRIVTAGLSLAGLTGLVLGGMISTPLRQPPTLQSIITGSQKVDRSDLPEAQRFQARDGTSLAYRVYDPGTPADAQLAVLVHGSAGHSANMHALGKALAAAGVRAVAVDIRGHGLSGARGDIGYLGQLDDDMADAVAHLRASWPQAPITLAGHSAGGGFVLRTAGGPNGKLFDRYVLLAPYLDPFASTTRPSSGAAGWAGPDIPRILGIAMLKRMGFDWCDALPVIAFALPPESALRATRVYTYRLLQNFGAGFDYHHWLDGVHKPLSVVAGADDELMFADKYTEALHRPGLDVRTSVVPGVDHMGLLAAPASLASIVAAIKQ